MSLPLLQDIFQGLPVGVHTVQDLLDVGGVVAPRVAQQLLAKLVHLAQLGLVVLDLTGGILGKKVTNQRWWSAVPKMNSFCGSSFS